MPTPPGPKRDPLAPVRGRRGPCGGCCTLWPHAGRAVVLGNPRGPAGTLRRCAGHVLQSHAIVFTGCGARCACPRVPKGRSRGVARGTAPGPKGSGRPAGAAGRCAGGPVHPAWLLRSANAEQQSERRRRAINAAPPEGCARAAGPGPQWGCGRSWGLDASTAHGSAHAAAQAENSRPASLNKQFFAYYLPRAQAAPLYRGAASAGDKRMSPGGGHATRKCAARQGAGLHRAEPVAPRGPPQSRGPRGSARGAPGAPKEPGDARGEGARRALCRRLPSSPLAPPVRGGTAQRRRQAARRSERREIAAKRRAGRAAQPPGQKLPPDPHATGVGTEPPTEARVHHCGEGPADAAGGSLPRRLRRFAPALCGGR